MELKISFCLFSFCARQNAFSRCLPALRFHTPNHILTSCRDFRENGKGGKVVFFEGRTFFEKSCSQTTWPKTQGSPALRVFVLFCIYASYAMPPLHVGLFTFLLWLLSFLLWNDASAVLGFFKDLLRLPRPRGILEKLHAVAEFVMDCKKLTFLQANQ